MKKQSISTRSYLLLAIPVLLLLASSQGQDSLKQIQDDYWRHQLNESISLRMKYGLPIEKLPDPSYEGQEKEAAFARSILDRLLKLDAQGLSHQEWISYEILKWTTTNTVEWPQHFYLASPVTPYASVIPDVHQLFQRYRFQEVKDLDHYLAVLRQYPALIGKLHEVLIEQFRRGLLLPKEELSQVLAFFQAYQKPAAESFFLVNPHRLGGLPVAEVRAFQEAARVVIDSRINPSLKKLTDYLDGEYKRNAPDAVGLGNYPGGKEAYRFLVRYHTTMDVTPEEVHQVGLDQVARINGEMQRIRESLTFQGTKADFHRFLKTDPQFYPKTSEEIGEKLMAYIRRIEPKIDAYFLRKPRAPYGVKRLDPVLEGSMTFGYYQDPTSLDPMGIYYYNGSNLNERHLFPAASLIYHELVPGHHFQICLQSENKELPQFRRDELSTAFVEGWAEYASGLAGEMGMYQDPYEQYGRLAAEMFLTCRLVVDTGMNYIGWSRTRAADFMKDNTLLSETEIFTETLRYSSDIPGQAVAYKMGSMRIKELRENARETLKERFDIRLFHDAVLSGGAMPMGVLEKHIDWFVKEQEAKLR